MKLNCFEVFYNISQVEKILSIFIFFHFFDISVVDFKRFVKLSSNFFPFMPSILLSSLGPNLVFFKILIFRGNILKNVYKEMLSFLTSIFPLCTLIPNSEIQKNSDKNLVFSTKNAARSFSNSSIGR